MSVLLEDEHSIEQAKHYLQLGETTAFFEMVATELLVEMPDEPVTHLLDILTQKTQKTKKTSDKSKADEIRYMKRHNISDFIDRWVIQLVTSKVGADETDTSEANKKKNSQDRLQFHINYLKKLVPDYKEHKPTNENTA